MAVFTLGKRPVTRLANAAGPRILVVDDDTDMMRITMHTLAGAGYRTMPARGGAEALRQVKLTRPDLVVTNLTMLDGSGVEVIERIKLDPETEAIPVLALTPCPSNDLTRSAADAGCDGFVAKPFQGTLLLREVERAITRSGSSWGPKGPRPTTPPDLCA